MKNYKKQDTLDNNIDNEQLKQSLASAIKVPLELFDDATETLYARIDREKHNYNNAIEHSIDYLTMSQSIMFEEFEGRDVNGIYSAFDDLIEKIERYHLSK